MAFMDMSAMPAPDDSPAAAIDPNAPPARVFKDISSLKRFVEDAQTTLSPWRVDAAVSRAYYDGPGQITDEMREVLKKRKQPIIWENYIKTSIDGAVGVIDANHTDPLAHPREPDMQDAADVVSDTLRYAADINHFYVTKADAWENALIEGAYGVIVEGAPDADVSITRINFEELFWDPRSRRPDFKDALYMGAAKWMYADQLALIYPEKAAEFDGWASSGAGISIGGADITWEDRPNNAPMWLDSKHRRIMTVDMYYIDSGEWCRAVFCAFGILEQGVSLYLDDKSKPRNPIEAGSCYVGGLLLDRYGAVRDMRPAQDEINARRSKTLHLLNVRQVQQTDPNAPPVAVDTVRAEAARPDGVIPPGWQIIPTQNLMEGHMEMMKESVTFITRIAPDPSELSGAGADASGRAMQIRQQAQMMQLQRPIGRFLDWEKRVYDAVWATCRQFWTGPKWIRVTHDDEAPQFIQINELTAQGVPQVDPQTGQPAVNPQTGQPVWQTPPQYKNRIAEMDVDISIDQVPETGSLQQEVWSELVGLAKSDPAIAQILTPEVIIQLSPLPRKRELLQMIQAARQQNAQAGAAQQQIAMRRAIVELILKESEAVLNFAKSKNEQITGIAAAATAHIDIATAERIADQYMAGTPDEQMALAGGQPQSQITPPQPAPTAPAQ